MKTLLITLAILAALLTVPMMFGAIWAFIELEDEERTWREFEEDKHDERRIHPVLRHDSRESKGDTGDV
jgi:hypothetical protein